MLRLARLAKPICLSRGYCINKNVLNADGLHIKLQAKKIDELRIYLTNLQSTNLLRLPYISIEIKYLESNGVGSRMEYKGLNIEELMKRALDDFLKSQN